jgi:hypothetical protein
MKEYMRTYKALMAIAMGKFIVRYDWLKESEFLEKLLKPDKYYFNSRPELYEAIGKVREGFRVFKGLNFCLGSQEYHLPLEQIENIIAVGGGETVNSTDTLTEKQKKSGNFIGILRNPDERSKQREE